MACCTLHNLMRVRYPALQNAQVDQEDPITHELLPGTWREEVTGDLQNLVRMKASRVQSRAVEIRKYLINYVNNVGSVPWQNEMI